MIPAISLANMPTQASASNPRVTRFLEQWVGKVPAPKKVRVGGVALYAPQLAGEFYARRDFQPAWISGNRLDPQATQMIQTLQHADRDGFRPNDYHIKKILKLFRIISEKQSKPGGKVKPVRLAALDILLTDAFFLYAAHLAYGRVNPEGLDVRLPEVEQSYYLPGYLEDALTSQSVSDTLQNLSPKHKEYFKLRDALARYREIAGQLDRLMIYPVPPLAQGERDPKRIPALRVKLATFGDLDQTTALDETLFDETVAMGLRRFQVRHGLSETGELDTQTLRWLNTPLDSYIRTMELNMERWRWMPVARKPSYILVNIPGFSLQVMERNRPVLSMRVVVGQTVRRTPIFNDRLRFIVLNPYWEIPPNILLKDKFYALKHDPDFFRRGKLEVIKGWGKKARRIDPKSVDWKKVPIKEYYQLYRFRQASGASNPLGRIKFMFPNEFNVYLHDTPKRRLFEEDVRSFSSGCIRLEKPVALAEYCLRANRIWQRKRLRAALKGKVEQKIKLTRPIPIHILYWTAWVDPENRVHFRQDIYGRDHTLNRAFRDQMHVPLR